MFYLFSSDFAPRYKSDILDILCYPEGHIFRFRYQNRHVSPEIKNWGESQQSLNEKLIDSGSLGVIIYAETTGESPNKTFTFYPVREVSIIRIQIVGTVYYLDLKLGKFIDYRGDPNKKQLFQTTIEKLKFHPLPPLTPSKEQQQKEGLTWYEEGRPVAHISSKEGNQGYFLHHISTACTCLIPYSKGGLEDLRAWESMVNVLSSAPSMKFGIFYFVEGFYQVKRRWLIGPYKESLIEPSNNSWETKYPLKMGKSVVLKLLFYRSSDAARILPQMLEIKSAGDAFAGFSETEILVLSRYNEERILIACKRVFDSIFAPITIELKEAKTASSEGSPQLWQLIASPETWQKTDQPILAPRPFLLTQITAPWGLIAFTLFMLAFASFFLFMSPDYVQQIGYSRLMQGNFKTFGDMLTKNSLAYSNAAKVFGAICTLFAGFLGFRKLPIGK